MSFGVCELVRYSGAAFELLRQPDVGVTACVMVPLQAFEAQGMGEV